MDMDKGCKAAGVLDAGRDADAAGGGGGEEAVQEGAVGEGGMADWAEVPGGRGGVGDGEALGVAEEGVRNWSNAEVRAKGRGGKWWLRLRRAGGRYGMGRGWLGLGRRRGREYDRIGGCR
jgi:hypothetical protein